MSEERLTIEQEAALVLEQMARLKQENLVATIEERRRLAELEGRTAAVQDTIAEINAERDGELTELETRAKGLGLRAEQTIRTEHGTIGFKAGYLRVTYDAKGLDAVAKVPEHGWIRQYRKESSIAPSVKVEVDEAV